MIGFTDGKASLFEISDMDSVTVLDERGKAPDDFDAEAFILREVYGFGGDDKPVVVRCSDMTEAELEAVFEKRVHLLIRGENEFSAAVEVPPARMLPWALQNIERCEIISPPELREDIIERIKRNVYSVGSE